jgi:hypothetical protein
MTTSTFRPPADPVAETAPLLRSRGYANVDGLDTPALFGTSREDLAALEPSWDDLPADPYLKDGGRYRSRRHSCFVVAGDRMTAVPHRAHWQPLEYNALHGGMQRWFEPMRPDVVEATAWSAVVTGIASLCRDVRPAPRWYVEAHQFRIDTAGGIGRPTPEGAHRDGVDFVAVLLIRRSGIKGGETRVFDANGPNGQRFTMIEPWTMLLLDDTRVIHETTPIQPTATDGEPALGFRDTLVLTYRAGGFQGDGAAEPSP